MFDKIKIALFSNLPVLLIILLGGMAGTIHILSEKVDNYKKQVVTLTNEVNRGKSTIAGLEDELTNRSKSNAKINDDTITLRKEMDDIRSELIKYIRTEVGKGIDLPDDTSTIFSNEIAIDLMWDAYNLSIGN